MVDKIQCGHCSDPLAHLRVLTLKQICQLTSYTRQHIGRMERAGSFPKRRRMGGNRPVWLQTEYEHWFKGLPIVELPPEPDEPLA